MSIKKLHYITGLILLFFITLHLLNHSLSLFGVEKHIEFMHLFRFFYRNVFVETLLITTIFVQIISGVNLFLKKQKKAVSFFDKIQIWSGLYLMFFLVIHVSAVFTGRLYLHLDTDFYFGAAGLNTFPYNLFFIPYYTSAIISFFSHLAAVHNQKMKSTILGVSTYHQSKIIVCIGVGIAFIILYGLTNHFHGFSIPQKYNVLIGK